MAAARSSVWVSESSTSREPYRVKCGTIELPAGVWLSDELTRYRKNTARPR